MSYSDYWDGDPEIVKYYRDKRKYEQEYLSFQMWLQGAYIYEAIIEASPVYNFFSKHRKPEPYREQPIPIGKVERQHREEERQRQQMAAGKKIMMGLMESVNAKFKKEKQTYDSQNGNS